MITRQQKGGVLVSISSQYMKVNDIHVRNVTTRQHKRGVLDSISSQYMKVNNIHVHRDGYFDVETWIKLDIFSSWFMYLNHCTKNIQELLLSADQISQISQISWVGSVISQH